MTPTVRPSHCPSSCQTTAAAASLKASGAATCSTHGRRRRSARRSSTTTGRRRRCSGRTCSTAHPCAGRRRIGDLVVDVAVARAIGETEAGGTAATRGTGRRRGGHRHRMDGGTRTQGISLTSTRPRPRSRTSARRTSDPSAIRTMRIRRPMPNSFAVRHCCTAAAVQLTLCVLPHSELLSRCWHWQLSKGAGSCPNFVERYRQDARAKRRRPGRVQVPVDSRVRRLGVRRCSVSLSSRSHGGRL